MVIPSHSNHASVRKLYGELHQRFGFRSLHTSRNNSQVQFDIRGSESGDFHCEINIGTESSEEQIELAILHEVETILTEATSQSSRLPEKISFHGEVLETVC